MAPRPLWAALEPEPEQEPEPAVDTAISSDAALGWAQPATSAGDILPQLELLNLWRESPSSAERAARLQQQILRAVNAKARSLLEGGEYASAQPLLRSAENLIAADASGTPPRLPSAMVSETYALCSWALCSSARRIPNEGAQRAAAARLKRAVQYDARVVALDGRRRGGAGSAERLARAHGRLACAHSELGQSASADLQDLVRVASGGQVGCETIQTIGASLRACAVAEGKPNAPQLIAAAAAAAAAAAEAGTTGVAAARAATEKAPRSAGKQRRPSPKADPRVAEGTPAATVAAASRSGRSSAPVPGWNARQTVHTRIGFAPPPVPRPMYTSAAERSAAEFGWQVGDIVQARQRESGQWVDAKIDAKRRKPGGGWYVVSLSGSVPWRMRTDEIRQREKQHGSGDSVVHGNSRGVGSSKEQAHYRGQLEYGRQFLQDMEELFAFNTALKPERILRPDQQEAAYREAMGRLDEEDAAKAKIAADAKKRLRYQATIVADGLIDVLITTTLDAVEERRRTEDQKTTVSS